MYFTQAELYAIEQVIHFETMADRADKAWFFGGNVNLPYDVNFIWAKRVDDDFHARFNAIARRYHYKIHNTKIRALWEIRALDIDTMQQASKYLLGKHDFSAFRNSLCQAKSPVYPAKQQYFIRHQSQRFFASYGA